MAIELPGEDAKILHIPAGSAIQVIGELADGSRMVNVEWEGRKVLMFVRDLTERGEQIAEASS